MRRLAWVVVAVAAVLVVAPVVLTAPMPSGTIRDVAGRFAPEGYETVGADSFEPRRLICLGDNPCPSVSRLWEFERPFTTERLQGWLDAAGYQATVDGDCATQSREARGTADGWHIYVLAFTPYAANGRIRLTLTVRG